MERYQDCRKRRPHRQRIMGCLYHTTDSVYLLQHRSVLIGYQTLSHPQTPDERPQSANNPRQDVNTGNSVIAYQDLVQPAPTIPKLNPSRPKANTVG